MKNRDKYILRRNEYDLLMTISENTGMCAVDAVGGFMKDIEHCCSHTCGECVQQWLNSEEE